MPRGRGGKGVDLFVIEASEQSVLDSLASGAQATLVNATIENVSTSEDYGSGSVKGLRIDVVIKPEAIIEFPPRLCVMILPSGMSVPSVTSAALRKASERFCWGDYVMDALTDPAATSIWKAKMHLKTARRFHSGDKFTLVVVNEDPNVAFGAAAVGYTFGKAYVTED